jgi:hypothetical protein
LSQTESTPKLVLEKKKKKKALVSVIVCYQMKVLNQKAYWLHAAPAGLVFKNFTFCHILFICFVFISKQIAFAPY